jgi:hypothetical protein
MSTQANPPPTPIGWATPENFQAIVKQVLTLLVTLGVLQTADAANLYSQIAACIAAASIFAFNAWQVVSFIKAQHAIKVTHLTNGNGNGNGAKPLLMVLALVLGATPATAQCPCGPSCPCPTVRYISAEYTGPWLPWRQRMEQQLQTQREKIANLEGQLQAQQRQPNAPAPLPIAGNPQQQLPIQGAPLQSLPLQGQPLQVLPLSGNPHLLVPINGQPLQVLPIAQQPAPQQQQLPVAPAPPAPAPAPPQPQPKTMPPVSAPGQPQSYTVRQYALHRPQER